MLLTADTGFSKDCDSVLLLKKKKRKPPHHSFSYSSYARAHTHTQNSLSFFIKCFNKLIFSPAAHTTQKLLFCLHHLGFWVWFFFGFFGFFGFFFYNKGDEAKQGCWYCLRISFYHIFCPRNLFHVNLQVHLQWVSSKSCKESRTLPMRASDRSRCKRRLHHWLGFCRKQHTRSGNVCSTSYRS